MRTLVGETLPYILRDNKDSLTDPSTRSRNTQMALNYLAAEQKAKDAKELAATNHGMASGMTVNFNVTSGIRGISTPEAITITQDNEQ